MESLFALAADPLGLGFSVLLLLMGAAFFAGVIDSVAGGGGLISLPATLLAGVPPHLALGTGKFMASVGTLASFITYARNGAVEWKVAAIGVFFSFAGSIAGSKTALLVDSAVLGKILIFLLPLAALLTFTPVKTPRAQNTHSRRALYILTPLLCLAIGFYDGFFGPATGSFMLLGLHLILGLGLISASATAKAFNLASNVSSLVVFLISGNVYFFAAVPMAAANMVGNILGSRMALKGGPAVIRKMLLFSLSLLFLSLVWRYFGEGAL